MSGPNDPKPGDKPKPGQDDPRPRVTDEALEAAGDMRSPANFSAPSKEQGSTC